MVGMDREELAKKSIHMTDRKIQIINERIMELGRLVDTIKPIEIMTVVDHITTAIACRGKVFICGCGGSAAQAQHFAAELVGRYKRERYGLPAIALTADTAILTAVANDYGFETVFSRQLQALSRPGDLLIAFSTSGRSLSIINAVKYARLTDVRTIAFTGQKGADFAVKCDYSLMVESEDTARIQEVHLLMVHMICEILEGSFVVESSPSDR